MKLSCFQSLTKFTKISREYLRGFSPVGIKCLQKFSDVTMQVTAVVPKKLSLHGQVITVCQFAFTSIGSTDEWTELVKPNSYSKVIKIQSSREESKGVFVVCVWNRNGKKSNTYLSS